MLLHQRFQLFIVTPGEFVLGIDDNDTETLHFMNNLVCLFSRPSLVFHYGLQARQSSGLGES